MMKLDKYKFTQNWVDGSYPDIPKYWYSIIQDNKYKRLLEIGTLEGRSLLYFVDAGIISATCIDIWKTSKYFSNFNYNQKVLYEDYPNLELLVLNGYSWDVIGSMLETKKLEPKRGFNKQEYDIIYVDASKYPHNTMIDACMAFRVLRKGGCIIFDDYNWKRDNSNLTPKIGIDAFEKTHYDFIKQAEVNEYQKAWYKTDDIIIDTR